MLKTEGDMMIKRIRTAKSRSIADTLREELSSLRTYRGMPAVSAGELADQYGVSVPTAHNALNILVREGLLYRVRGSGTFFSQDNPGKQLRIGIADQTVSPEYLSADSNRILDYHFARAAQYFQSSDCSVRFISYAELMSGNALADLDGLLVSALFIDAASVKLLQASGIPVVVYRYSHSFQNNYHFSKLFYGLDSGMREALDYLKPDADSRIILIAETTPSGRFTAERWQKNLTDYGIRKSRIRRYDIEVPEREISCYRLVRVQTELFHDAVILTGNDEIALNISNALLLEGLVGGRDYRLVGQGNLAGYGFPAVRKMEIASIDLPIALMAEEAAKLLLFKIGKSSVCESESMVPTRFIPRKSAGSDRKNEEAPVKNGSVRLNKISNHKKNK